MSSWYFRKDNQNEGPFSAEEVVMLLRSGQIDMNTLVWRDGMKKWLPLSKRFHEIHPDSAEVFSAKPETPPPPLPPQLFSMGKSPPEDMDVPDARSGCLVASLVIVAIVTVVGLIMGFFIQPVYQRHIHQNRIEETIAYVKPLQEDIEGFVLSEGRCPTSRDITRVSEMNTDYAHASFELNRRGGRSCIIEINMQVPSLSRIDGHSISLEYQIGRGWSCKTRIDAELLPPSCTG